MKIFSFGLIIAYLLISITLSAQKEDKKLSRLYSDAVAYAEEKNYTEAIDILRDVLKEDPNSPEALYYLGYCFLNTSNGADSSIIYFQKGLDALPEEDYNSNLGVDMQYSLARSKHMLMRFEEAINSYEKLLEVIPVEDEVMQKRIQREIEMCYNGSELVKKPVKLEVENLGDKVNTSRDDHSPLISADGEVLFYTTRRPSSYSELMPDGQYSEKIYYSIDTIDGWSKGKIINKLFKKEGHESCVAISADGQELYLYRNDPEGKNIYQCLYDGSTWSEPIKLQKPVNTVYDETHVTLSPDKSVLYFTSNRPGGYGGLDIYRVRRLPNGEWAVPQNLGPEINTQYDEETPMLHPDGRTLYFSSEGHNSMGGFDIFISRQEPDSAWSEPVNMGYPINTPDDDMFFVPTVSYNQAYYASARFKDNYGGMDLYLVKYEEPVENRLAVMKGTVLSEDDTPLETIRVFVTEKITNSMVGQYKPHAGTGKYVMILEAEKTYQLRYAGEGFDDYVVDLPVDRSMTYSTLQSANKVDDVTMIAVAETEEVSGSEVVSATYSEDMDVSDGIPYYTVQILTLDWPVKSWDNAFEGLDQNLIKEYRCKNSKYRYAYGAYKGYKATLKAKEEVLSKTTKFGDSFVRDVQQYDDLVEANSDDQAK